MSIWLFPRVCVILPFYKRGNFMRKIPLISLNFRNHNPKCILICCLILPIHPTTKVYSNFLSHTTNISSCIHRNIQDYLNIVDNNSFIRVIFSLDILGHFSVQHLHNTYQYQQDFFWCHPERQTTSLDVGTSRPRMSLSLAPSLEPLW